MDRRPVRVLVDTHTLVWALTDPALLSPRARKSLASSEVVASAASLWELILKSGKKGSLVVEAVRWWEKYVSGNRVEVVNIRVPHISLLEQLPPLHRDPFDRILVAQAMAEDMPLVSKDLELTHYGIRVIW
jgi:PIN domain nuclease of toxin-antitoxin system